MFGAPLRQVHISQLTNVPKIDCHPDAIRFDAALKKFIFYISLMYEFSHGLLAAVCRSSNNDSSSYLPLPALSKHTERADAGGRRGEGGRSGLYS